PNEKQSLNRDEFINTITDILDEIQNNLFTRAQAFKEENTYIIDKKEDFYELYEKGNGNMTGGFVMAHWCGKDACESKIKEELSVTIRCIPFDNPEEAGKCIYCNNASSKRVLFSKAY
ncbi:MAG: proline--tRNA ligase, partial [Desulfobacteraceae bacterium]|nr:proline--tRNA ligase [Desulfobacteraceae bacterium]